MKFGVGLMSCRMLATFKDLNHHRVRSTFKHLSLIPYGCFDSRRHLIHLIADGYGIITLVLNPVNDNQLPLPAQHRGYLFIQRLWFIYGVIVCRLHWINNQNESGLKSSSSVLLSLDYHSTWLFSLPHADFTAVLSGFVHGAICLWEPWVSLLVFSTRFTPWMFALQFTVVFRFVVPILCATAWLCACSHGAGC